MKNFNSYKKTIKEIEKNLKKHGVIEIQLDDSINGYKIREHLYKNNPFGNVEEYKIIENNFGYNYLIICNDFINLIDIN
jgi:hypothetical protein